MPNPYPSPVHQYATHLGSTAGRRYAGRMARHVARHATRNLIPYAGNAMAAYEAGRGIVRMAGRKRNGNGHGPPPPPKKMKGASAAATSSHNTVESKELEVVYTDKSSNGKVKSPNTAYTTKEINHICSDPKAVYIGGSTFIPNQISEDVCTALVRYCARKCGQDAFNIMDVHTDVYIVSYFDVLQSDGAQTPATVVIPAQSGSATWFDWAVAIKTRLIAIGSGDKKLTFQRFVVSFQENNLVTTDFRDRIIVNMNKAKVEFKVTQECNFQNVTTNEGGGVSTDVSNINPLEMTVYSGKGTGAKLLLRTNNATKAPVPFSGTFANGEISVIATDYTRSGGVTSTGNDWNTLAEPISSKCFRGTKTHAKKIVMPGGIARTHLTSHDSMSWDRFWEVIRLWYFANINANDPVTVNPATPGPHIFNVGKHLFCGFEKIVNSVGTENNVEVKMEINNKIVADFHPGKNRPNAPKFFQTTIATHVST